MLENEKLFLRTYITEINGEPHPDNEIHNVKWIPIHANCNTEIGSGIAKFVIPKIKRRVLMSKNLLLSIGIAALFVGITFGFNSNIVKMANVNGVETINIILYQLVIGLVYFIIRYLVSNPTYKSFTPNIFKIHLTILLVLLQR